ncbi:MAG: amidohydrolase [Rhodospirillaceae bacterium]|nr:amidohydrolase [Rhodospirillaceae bacterium]
MYNHKPMLAPIGRRYVLGRLAAMAVLGFGGAVEGAEQADLVLINARIWTGDRRRPRARAIAIAGNRIMAVGDEAGVRRRAGRGARTIDLGGRFVMPGLNDSHVHFTRMAAGYGDINLLGTTSIDQVLDAIKARVDTTPRGEWVQSRAQWHEALLKEGRMPTRTELDRVAPAHPVYLPRGGHVAAVNSKALEIAGITRMTQDPPGGMVVRDTNGEATGLLLESSRAMIMRHIKPVGREVLRANLKRQIAEFNALGLTSITNPGTSPAEVEMLGELHRVSPLSLRIHWTARAESVDEVKALRARYELGWGDDILKFSGIGEVGIDGGIEGAYLRTPYNIVPGEQDDPTYRGIIMPLARDEDKCRDFYLAAIDAGLNVMTHITGDGALDVALRILAKVNDNASYDHLRWTLHGCFLTDASQLAEIRRLGLYITGQTQPYLLGAQMNKWWGRERTDRSMPFRAFLDAKVPVGGGSDASAGIANPFESMGWMVNRRCMGDLLLDKRWSVSPEEAMGMYTLGSAETQFMDDQLGILNVGMLADIAILSDNPITVPPEKIYDIGAEATIMDGRVVHDRAALFA